MDQKERGVAVTNFEDNSIVSTYSIYHIIQCNDIGTDESAASPSGLHYRVGTIYIHIYNISKEK